MDRYQGPDMSAEEAQALALLQAEPEEWERDAQAIAEWERWNLDRLMAEQSAEWTGAR